MGTGETCSLRAQLWKSWTRSKTWGFCGLIWKEETHLLWAPDPGPHHPLPTSLLPHLTTLHGTAQVAQQAIRHSHVVLAHGPVLEAPAFAIVIDELCGLAGEEQSFLVVLQGHREGWGEGHAECQELPLSEGCRPWLLWPPGAHRPRRVFIHPFWNPGKGWSRQGQQPAGRCGFHEHRDLHLVC